MPHNHDQLLLEDAMYAFLNAYWLRPEHAIWFYYDWLEYQRHLQYFDADRSIDIGCGDGVTSFLFNNGRFGLNFDVYRSVDKSVTYRFDRSHDDFYDCFHEAAFKNIPIIQKPDRTYEYGLDYKDGLINKASSLGLYRNTLKHDFNISLPFDANHFGYIFSNTVYHARDVDLHLRDLYRVLDKDGILHMYCPSETFKKFAMFRFYHQYGWEWVVDHDRGRYDVWAASAKDYAGWKHQFEKVGYVVEDARAYLPFVVTMIEDVGLRAIFPSLIRMADTILKYSLEDYLEVKRYWMENLFFLLEPFKDVGWVQRARPLEYVWFSFILRRP